MSTKSVLSPPLTRLRHDRGHGQYVQQQQARLDEAFNRIEETILPCIAMMLDTLLDASANLAELDPKALVAELQTLAAELEELTRAVERSRREQCRAGRVSRRRGLDGYAR